MGENIFLFVPNLIGYTRIVLAVLSFYYMPFDHEKAIICYVVSGFLDALDGTAARYWNQGTKFGAILDQLTDRAASMCLLMVLGQLYPKYMLVFQLSCTLDIVGHWIHIWSTMMTGAESHKSVDLSTNPVLRIYYNSRPVLFFMCAGNELFYSMLYLTYFTPGPEWFGVLFGYGLWQWFAVISLPIAAVKSLISAVHLYAACVNVAAIDAAERQSNTESEVSAIDAAERQKKQ